MRNKVLYSIICIAVLTCLSFSSSLDNEFTNWDDDKYVTDNPLIQNISLENVKIIFTTFYKEAYRQPLALLSYSIEYYFFKMDPFIYHLDNLILHIVNSILVFFLIKYISQAISVSLITALLFAIHPLHVESVAWISERKDVLSTLFFLQTLLFYLLYKKRKMPLYYALSLVIFILALFTKAMVVTIPFVLFLFDYLTGRRFDRDAALEKVPFFILGGAFGFINLFIFKSSKTLISMSVLSPLDNILIACKNIIFYVIKILFPFNLSAHYAYTGVVSFLKPEFFLSVIFLLTLAAAIFYSIRYTRKIIFGSLFALVTLLPVLQILPFGGVPVADRYMYIPSIGLFYMMGSFYQWLYERHDVRTSVSNMFPLIALCIVVFTFSVLTYHRNNVWQDSKTLWTDTVTKSPNSPIAHINLGEVYHDLGRLDDSIKEYNVAIRLAPNASGAYYNLGLIYLSRNQLDQAIEVFKVAVKINPTMGYAHYNLGSVYSDQNRLDDAITAFLSALKYVQNPDMIATVHNNLGNVYARKGLLEEAADEYKRALKINPNHKNSLRNLAIVRKKLDMTRSIEK